jgi:hypothetical protein
MSTMAQRPIKKFAELDVLRTPPAVQDFVSSLAWNFEPNGDECRSVQSALETKSAHCIEAAMVAAYAFWMHGRQPIVMDLRATDEDFDHVVALFRQNGKWGAISKSNHAYLRYRDPVYRTLRELAMSYFHEYFNANGTKTLLSYSRSFDLRTINVDWVAGKGNIWEVPKTLDSARHFSLVSKNDMKGLRPIEKFEKKAFSLSEH